MKILSALKKIKHLDRKIQQNKGRIKDWCSYITDAESPEPPAYDAEEIRRMIQQISDWSEEKVRIRHALHRTNMETEVEWRGKTFNIDELLLLRTISIPNDISTLRLLLRKEKGSSFRSGLSAKDERVVLQYDPKERDKTIESLEHMLMELDDLLDEINISTEVVGLD